MTHLQLVPICLLQGQALFNWPASSTTNKPPTTRTTRPITKECTPSPRTHLGHTFYNNIPLTQGQTDSQKDLSPPASDIPSPSRTGPPTTMTHLPSQMHLLPTRPHPLLQGHSHSPKEKNPHTRPYLFPLGHSPSQDFMPPQTMTHPLPQGHTSCNEKASHLKM